MLPNAEVGSEWTRRMVGPGEQPAPSIASLQRPGCRERTVARPERETRSQDALAEAESLGHQCWNS